MLDSFSIALKVIFRDPINILLSIIPTAIALALYVLTIVAIWRNSDRFVSLFRGYIYTSDSATILANILTGILIIFIFFLMSWTFIIIVGIIAAPFNSMLSARIEKKLVEFVVEKDKHLTFEKIGKGLGHTFVNEFKKLFFLAIMACVVFVLDLFPLFYPIGVMLVSILLAVQFLDYSWSRHDMNFGSCLKEVLKNFLPYMASGFFFLLFVAIPIINSFVPAFATSYYTVLWLKRQRIIQ